MNNVIILCIIVNKLINGSDNIKYTWTQSCTYIVLISLQIGWLHTAMSQCQWCTCPLCFTGQWSPIAREDS